MSTSAYLYLILGFEPRATLNPADLAKRSGLSADEVAEVLNGTRGRTSVGAELLGTCRISAFALDLGFEMQTAIGLVNCAPVEYRAAIAFVAQAAVYQPNLVAADPEMLEAARAIATAASNGATVICEEPLELA